MAFRTNGSERMRIDSSGNVRMGDNGSNPTDTDADNLIVANASGAAGIQITSSSSSVGKFVFGDTNNARSGMIYYSHISDFMRFDTGANERMRIDSSGNLLVGTTDTQPPTNSDPSGIALRSDGKIAASRSNGIAGDFNNNSEGNIVWFRKNGTVVATVSTRTGGGDAPYFSGYTNADTGIAFSSTRMYPVTSSGVVANGTRDLGNTDARWGNLWLAGGVYLGGTGAANKLDDYEEGTFSPTLDASSSSPTVVYADQYGAYTRVGRLVTVDIYLITNSRSGGSGELRISNLPYTVSSNTYLNKGTGAIVGYKVNTEAESAVVAIANTSQLGILSRSDTSTSGTWGTQQIGDWSAANTVGVRCSVTYITDS